MKHRTEASHIAAPFIKYHPDHDSLDGSQSEFSPSFISRNETHTSSRLYHSNSRSYLPTTSHPRTEPNSWQMSYPESSQRTVVSEDVKTCLPYPDEEHGRGTTDMRLHFPSNDVYNLPSMQEHILSPPAVANIYHGSPSIAPSHQTELHNSHVTITHPSTTNFHSPLYLLKRPTSEKELLDCYDCSSQLGSGIGTTRELCDADVPHDLGTPISSPGSSIPMPMRNMNWSSVSQSGTFAQAQALDPSNPSVNQSLDSSPSDCQASKHPEQQNYQPASSSSLAIESTKKKKSKMHQCEVCGKLFPRPSGLKTHMNTHNNLKPFPCGFEGCSRTFTVRSNAKRHLRTHGVEAISSRQVSSPPYSVGFDIPTIVPPPITTTNEVTTAPSKLRWMPPSLSACTNATSLVSVSDDEFSDEEYNLGLRDQRESLATPCLLAVPSSSERDLQGSAEERNSYIEVSLYSQHPLQFEVLPGPVVALPAGIA